MRGRSFKTNPYTPRAVVVIMLLLSTFVLVPEVSDNSEEDDEPLVDYGTRAGENWLTGWSYRKYHNITGSTGAGTDYQVKIETYFDEYYNITLNEIPTWRCAKPVILGSDRYIVVAPAPWGNVKVYEANSNWTLGSLLGTSASSLVSDSYAKVIPSQISDKIIIFGYSNVGGNERGYIATYKPSTNDWDWADVDGLDNKSKYITDVEYASVTDRFYIVPAGDVAEKPNWVWESTLANLTIPANWTKKDMPSWTPAYVSLRITYLSGDFMFVGRRNLHYYYDVLKWNLTDDSFDTLLSSTDTNTESQNIFFYLKANPSAGMIGLSLPQRTPTKHWNISYSTGGSFTNVTEVPLLMDVGYRESQNFVYPIESDTLLVHNVQNGHPNGFIALYDLSGNEKLRHTGVKSHYTERGVFYDGTKIVIGGENFPDLGYGNPEIKVLTPTDGEGENVSLNGNCRTDFGDIRFTDDDGSTELDYWMEKEETGGYATFWVEVADDLNSTQTIYIYYGKSDATTTSNGTNTFLLFDDFLGSSLNTSMWSKTETGGGTVTVADGRVKLHLGTANGDAAHILSLSDHPYTAGRSRVDREATLKPNVYNAIYSHYIDGNNFVGMGWITDAKFRSRTKLTGTETYNEIVTPWAGNHTYDQLWKSGQVKFLIDDDLKQTHTTNIISNDAYVAFRNAVSGGVAASATDTYVDWVLNRKYVDSEPAHAAWGSEESPACPTTIYSIATGTWQTTTTWKGGCIPATGDSAYIATGDSVTLDDNRTVKWIQINSTSTLQIGDDTPLWDITLTFDDASGTGFSGTGAGTFITKGTATYGMTLRSENSPPTTQWNGGMANVDVTMDWTTVQDLDKASGAGTWDVENTTFTHSGTDFVVHLQYLTKFANVTISTTTGHGMYMADDFLEYYNVVITSGSGKKDVQAEARLEFQYSNFDVSKVVFGGLGPPTGGNLTSLHHNDVVGAYKIGTGTIQYPRNLKKSQITHDFYSGCDVELFEGSFVIDENADADTMFIQSGAIVIHEAATTLDVATNLTVNGTFIGNGTVTDSGNYFDFWIGGGSVWLNNSTVSKAKLVYYYGGFNFTVGNSANSTINEWTLEAPSGIDTDFNITYYDFNNKNSGTIWRMTVTASSGSVKFCTSNLTSGQYYRSYVESISHTEGIADSGNYYNFSYNSWSTKVIYLTWFTPTPYNSRITIGVEGEEPGPGQWDRWTIGFSYSKHWITNEVRFHAIMIDETQRYNASYYIWEFGDGATYESASPNITHTFKWGLYTIEDVKLTVVMKNGVEYKIKEGLLLDNTLIVALICLGVITFATIAIQRTRKKRQREELIMVETEGR